MAKLIFGCGYLGQRVARRWLALGETVYAVTRKPTREAELAVAGIRPVIADITRPATLRDLPTADSVLFAVGLDRSTGHSVHQVYVDGLAAVLDVLAPETQRFVYISSTGVYGQEDGSWVDEESECQPVREGGKACWAAEQLLNAHPIGARSIVLRLAGIYGPDRVPRKKDLLSSVPIQVAMNGYLNLIHVDDAAGIVVTAERQAIVPNCYVVSDGQPVLRRDYFEEIVRLLDLPPQTVQPPSQMSSAAERARGDKRVCSDRLFRELPIELQYPSYREGLAAALTSGSLGRS